MNYTEIRFTIEDAIATAKFNRPNSMNSYTEKLHNELMDILKSVQEDKTIRCLVISGEGKAFSVGQDLKDPLIQPGDTPPELGKIISDRYNPLILAISQLNVPIICGVNGIAAGAGVNIALACDIVIACESASFIQAFSQIGLIPDSGGTFILPKLIGRARAMGSTLLGEKITAAQAEEWGMIWKCVPDEEFEATIKQISKKITSLPTRALALTKKAIMASFNNRFEKQLDLERDYQQQAGETSDYKEGITAFLEKRRPEFTGR